MEAVGEDAFEDRDSCGEDMRDDGADDSGANKSLFNSSLLLRETEMALLVSMFVTL